MNDVDRLFALSAWLVSLVVAYYIPPVGYMLVIATTVNLIHWRLTDWFAGSSLRQRVQQYLADDLKLMNDRLELMKHDVDDVKESQVKIAGAWRGRNLP